MPYVTVSHGADFFGEDHHPLKYLISLAGYAEGCLSRDERQPLAPLLWDPDLSGTVPADKAAEVSNLLIRLARHRFVKGRTAAVARALADAAARAAADGEPWQWRIEAAA